MSDEKPIRPLWAIRLRAERETRGWGTREMARQVLTTARAPRTDTRVRSLSRQLRHWELGQHFPRDWASWLAKTFDMDEAELFGSDHVLPTFGKMMYRHMSARQIRLADLAQRVGVDVAELARICDDIVPPSPGLAERLDVLLQAEGRLAPLAPPPAPEPLAVPPSTVDITGSPDDWDDMERRRLLQAALGFGAAALGPESVRRLTELALTTAPRDLDDWHLTCDDHLHAVRTRSPAQAREDILIDLIALDGQLKTVPSDQLVEWQRVQSAMATLHANVLSRLGEHGAAIRWWRTAKAAADASGDLELQLGVRATETGHARYGQRTPETVLRLTKDAYRIMGDRPSLGRALVTCSDAKALSDVGRHSEALRTLNACEDLFAAARQPLTIMPSYWAGGQLQFAQLLVHAGAGDESRVHAAMDQSLAILSRTSDRLYVPQVHLHGAICTIVNGGIDSGMRRATTALDAVAPEDRNHMITETANTVLRAVPPGERERPAVREFREALTKTAPTPALASNT